MIAARRAAERENIETSSDVLLDAGTVWALLFNPGSDDEGIYSRRLGSTGQNMVLTFEEEDDAERYASMLVATDFPSASSVEIESSSLIEFCEEGGHLLGLVRRGSLVVPPEETVDEFDWSPGEECAGMAAEELDASRRSLERMFDAEIADEGGLDGPAV